jgi:hypothetical protein
MNVRRTEARRTVRRRVTALTVVSAFFGSAAVGIAALARAGVCLHELGLFGLDAHADESSVLAMHAGAPCPIMIGAALVAATLYIVALGALVVLRPSPRELALSSAQLVLGVGFLPRTFLLALIGGVPLAGAAAVDGELRGIAVPIAVLFLFAASALAAFALATTARVVLSFARRLVVALAGVVRLLVPDLSAVRAVGATPILVTAGARLARRRPSRAPPVRFTSVLD